MPPEELLDPPETAGEENGAEESFVFKDEEIGRIDTAREPESLEQFASMLEAEDFENKLFSTINSHPKSMSNFISNKPLQISLRIDNTDCSDLDVLSMVPLTKLHPCLF